MVRPECVQRLRGDFSTTCELRGRAKYGNCFALVLILAAAPLSGATKDQALPDKEMLRMMEFLREMEMIKQVDMMRDLQQVETSGAQARQSAPRGAVPAKKETAK